MNNLSKILGISALLFCTAPALQADSVSDLLSNSPFVPQGWTPGGGKAGSTANGQYVFRGVYTLDGATFVNIYEGEKGRWICVGESKDGISVSRYDEAAKKVTFTAAGREQTLEMPKPSTGSSPLGLAVNSDPRLNRKLPVVTTNTTSRRNLRPLPPPPGWANIRNNRNAQRSLTNSGGSSGNTVTDPSDPSDPSDPGTEAPSDDTDTPSDAPPPPPSFIPSIPPELLEKINAGQSPDNP
ncbi:MAG: hypothetical protein JW942_02910 [Opitutales bacterium]|nr:hypothetical protein [Opitutales bacterium]